MADSTGPLDSLYTKNFILGIVLSVCCGLIGIICSLICIFTTQNPVAKKNAIICLIIPFALGAIYFVVTMVFGVGAGLMGGR